MSKNKMNLYLKASVAISFFVCLAAVVGFKVGVLDAGHISNDGLSGMVSVKGAVSAKDLGLSSDEVKRINRSVEAQKGVFTQVDVFLDAKKGNPSDGKTVLVMAMVLETGEDCEIRSWSRKVPRAELVTQMEVYMKKAAREYEQFKRFPDVTQDFKCLYI